MEGALALPGGAAATHELALACQAQFASISKLAEGLVAVGAKAEAAAAQASAVQGDLVQFKQQAVTFMNGVAQEMEDTKGVADAAKADAAAARSGVAEAVQAAKAAAMAANAAAQENAQLRLQLARLNQERGEDGGDPTWQPDGRGSAGAGASASMAAADAVAAAVAAATGLPALNTASPAGNARPWRAAARAAAVAAAQQVAAQPAVGAARVGSAPYRRPRPVLQEFEMLTAEGAVVKVVDASLAELEAVQADFAWAEVPAHRQLRRQVARPLSPCALNPLRIPHIMRPDQTGNRQHNTYIEKREMVDIMALVAARRR